MSNLSIVTRVALLLMALCSGLLIATPSDGFDFPLGRPNGLGYRVFGGDFGLRFLEQYDYRSDGFPEYHPGEDWNDDNSGNDRGGDSNDAGDPIYAPSHGIIRYADYARASWGFIVVIEHAAPTGTQFRLPGSTNGVSVVWSQFGHMASVGINPTTNRRWAQGERIRRGEQIGTVGDYPNGSGESFHLHWEIRTQDRGASDFVHNTRRDSNDFQPWSRAMVMQFYVEPSAFVGLNRTIVAPLNQPPTAGFTMTSIPLQPVPHGQTLNLTVAPGGSANVFFDGSSPRSSDPDGTVTGWRWMINGAQVAATATFSRTFTAGRHDVGLVVTDNQGLTSQMATAIIAVSETPVVPLPPTYVITELGSLDGSSFGEDTNEARSIVGWYSSPALGSIHAFLWRNNTLINPVPSAVWSQAVGINTSDDIALTTQVSGGPFRAGRWRNGILTDLGPPSCGQCDSFAYAVNNTGNVVGMARFLSDARAFYWSEATGMINIGAMPGHTASAAVAINDNGDVVGVSGPASSGGCAASDGQSMSFLWTATGGLQSLIPSGALPSGCNRPTSINNQGTVIGYTEYSPGLYRGFVVQGGSLSFLPSNGGSSVTPYDLNSSGDIIGMIDNVAHMWTRGVVYRLSDRILNGSGVHVFVVTGINDRGDIVGAATNLQGKIIAVLLTRQ